MCPMDRAKQPPVTCDGLGELTGSYMGSGGWLAAHSKERFVDDLADLNPTKGRTGE
jgi:hypothetical protein